AVGDVLLKLLAENGKHFTALKDDERLTIAVTFRGPPPVRPPWSPAAGPAAAAKAANFSPAGTGTLTGPGMMALSDPTAAPPAAGPAAATKAANVSPAGIGTLTGPGMMALSNTTAAPQSAGDHALLADLHLKQGQPQQAIDALHKALKQAEAEALTAGDEGA